MGKPTTIADLLRSGDGSAAAIGAPGRVTMSRAELVELIDRVGGALRGLGLKAEDRVAIVMPNGAEMAAVFLAVACWGCAHPLNPAYRADELDFYLGDIDAKALLIQAAPDAPARAVAAHRGIPVIEVTPLEHAPAGSFALSAPFAEAGKAAPKPGDVALVLHTSGTTSRPKLVPLTHHNLASSALNIARTLCLEPADRCLVVMPLFHIHGLVGALLSSLAAGASVHCPPGFSTLKFFGQLDHSEATWYTAVPAMHQMVLSRADRNADVLARRKLRFIRSSSAPLPPRLMRALEEAFGCPVIESYGMTEASHQMASNPLPPAPRKPGSVGIAAGSKVAIMDAGGNLLPAGATGEIVIRGENVTPGYVDNPKANAAAFTNGWFRTGDQGMLDVDGYLRITGRLKEIINRGGEKIAPREVDDVIMDHPAVAQAVTFAMPNELLGEDVAAAVVLRDGLSVSESELRSFVGLHLADFKVPRRIVFLPEIPNGATGKPQRIGLAQKLGIAS